MTYERKFGRKLKFWQERGLLAGQIFAGQWFKFTDRNGVGWAQPDFFVLGTEGIILFELKLTQNSGAWEQLDKLYAPLLRHHYARPVTCIQVCKNLLVDDGTIVSQPGELTSGCTFHWIGR